MKGSGRQRTADVDAGSARGAYAAGLGLLARRELSAAQLRDRLASRGYTHDAIEQALGRLRASGAVDDARVAGAVARTRAQVKRQGRIRVLRELAAAGIDRETAEQAAAEVFGAIDEQQLLEAAIARRLRRGESPGDPVVRRRLYAALVRQGFSPAAIARALERRRDRDAEDD